PASVASPTKTVRASRRAASPRGARAATTACRTATRRPSTAAAGARSARRAKPAATNTTAGPTSTARTVFARRIEQRDSHGGGRPRAGEPPTMNTSAPAPGTTLLGKYRVERLLGEGGMGRVVEATHLELDQRVAIKLLASHDGREEEMLARFRNEARIVAR